jgi:hypothetical protein
LIVVDSSAWIEFTRATGSRAHLTVRRLLRERVELATTEIVVMEVLAGARSRADERALRRELGGFPILPLSGLPAFEAAAALFRACRAGGEPIRHLTDCLLAVPAIEAGATVLTTDADFEKLARHTPLQLEPLDE